VLVASDVHHGDRCPPHLFGLDRHLDLPISWDRRS
jgi:hypothetical protein